MKSFSLTVLFLVTIVLSPNVEALSQSKSVSELKKELLTLAKSYEGQADLDQSKQKSLEPLVEKLLKANPMPPIKERLSILSGAWKQVFGPYEYKKSDGSIDPTIGIFEIYQVVSEDGYYYNVAPYYPNGDKNKEQIGLLRGEFKLEPNEPLNLKVKFTDYPGVDQRPQGIQIWELPSLAESGQLENEITIVPSFIVKLFFGGGTLEEIYTDADMRVLYGSNNDKNARRFLYVMSRVK